ncbi:MATE family efflux transporter [Clostridium sp. UBA4548]|uniref:MATE family efflux transporter n=1 Tax=Clostridium sp. UBA4548 TaxID=1946361 RepID=UPI0025BE6C4B|nr:MATE family efflux transporter [Clostridium sp. UBA4548]
MKDMTRGSEAKLIFYFALPMLVGNVFQQLYNTVDSIIVGKFLGKDALAAVGTSFPIIFLLISLIMGVTMGSTILISQYFGAKDMDKVKKTIDTAYITLFFASIFITILGLIIGGPILRLINVPEEIFAQSKEYLDITFIGLIGMFGYNSVSAILRGLGDSKTPVYFLIISSVINIVLDLLFILEFNMGVGGAAWATIISQAISFVLAVIYLNRRHKVFKINIRHLEFDKAILKDSIRIGLPSGIQQMVFSFGMMMLQGLINGFGGNTMAAYAAASKIDSFASMPIMNFGAAISTFVGQNIGANKPERVKKGLNTTLIMSTVMSIGIALILILFAKPLVEIFTNEPQVVVEGANYINIVAPFYFVVGAMFIINGVHRGAGEAIFPMIISILSLWLIRLPIAYILSSFLGSNGIWWSIPAGWTFGAIATVIYYRSGKWKNKSLVKVSFNNSEAPKEELTHETSSKNTISNEEASEEVEPIS